MTLWEEIKIARAVLSGWRRVTRGGEEMFGKSLFTSKTFWLNLVAALIGIAGAVPAKYGVPVLAVLNIGNRLLTNQPIVALTGPSPR